MSPLSAKGQAACRGNLRGTATRERDASLVRRLLRAERGAAESLVKGYGDRVYRLAFRITGNREDAEEVTQDALWTAARKIHTFRGGSAFGTWLYRITANAAFQKLRGRRRRDSAETSWERLLPEFDDAGRHREPVEDWSARVEEPALQAELRSTLTAAVDALPPEYRTAFLLHDLQGMPNAEIARLLGISLPAVKSRIHRSRLFLRRRLGRHLAVA